MEKKLQTLCRSILFIPPLIPAGIQRNPQEWTGILGESIGFQWITEGIFLKFTIKIII